MTSPLVSVVIPTYNYGRFIAKTIESALSQTYSPIEIVVVDDGSTDDTRERLAAGGDRVRYIRQENHGPAVARNTGIEAARGEFIAFLDSDDLWLPDKLERQVAFALQHPDIGLLATQSFPTDEAGHQPQDLAESRKREGSCELTPRDLLEFGAFSPSSVLVRKDTLSAVGGFNEGLKGPEDMEMWVRIAVRSRVVRLNATLTGQREHSASLSHQVDGMFQNHQQAIASLFANVSALRQHPSWRRIAEARMYREAAWLRFTGGDRAGARKDLLLSCSRWPFALRSPQLCKRRLDRVKMFLNYSLHL